MTAPIAPTWNKLFCKSFAGNLVAENSILCNSSIKPDEYTQTKRFVIFKSAQNVFGVNTFRCKVESNNSEWTTSFVGSYYTEITDAACVTVTRFGILLFA